MCDFLKKIQERETPKKKKNQCFREIFLPIICQCFIENTAFYRLYFNENHLYWMLLGFRALKFVQVDKVPFISVAGEMKSKILSLPTPTALRHHSYQNSVPSLKVTVNSLSPFLFSSPFLHFVLFQRKPYILQFS